MNIIQKLTLRHMKMNRRRTTVTIVGVIISTAMLMAVSVFGTSFQQMMIQMTADTEGKWHVQYDNVAPEQISTIQNDEQTKRSAVNAKVGYATNDSIQMMGKPYLYIEADTKESFLDNQVKVVKGRLPENETELVVSKYANDLSKTEFQIGEQITVETGSRYSKKEDGSADKTHRLNQDYSYSESDEVFLPQGKKTYKICGIVERNTREQSYTAGFSAYTRLTDENLKSFGKVSIKVERKNLNRSIYDEAVKLGKKAGVPKGNINFHNSLLKYYGISGNSNAMQTLYSLMAIIYGLIIIGSVSLIYNAFAISLTERSRYLGMLGSVGATKRQKQQSVFFEGMVVGGISIPLGILAGVAGIGITLHFVGPMITEGLELKQKLGMHLTGPSFFVTILLAVLTIFISVWIPARRASKLSLIEVMNRTEDQKLTRRKIKTSFLTNRLFGIEGSIALKNLKRNRKRYRATLFSLIISIVLFIAVSAFSQLIQKSYRNYDPDTINYDVSIQMLHTDKDDEKEKVDKRIRELRGIEDITKVETLYFEGNINAKYFTEETKELVKEEKNGKVQTSFVFHALDDNKLKEYAKETGADYKKLKDISNPAGILMNKNRTIESANNGTASKTELLNTTDAKAGSKLKFEIEQYNNESSDREQKPLMKEVSMEMGAVTEKFPIGGSYGFQANSMTFYMSEDTLEHIFKDNNYLEIYYIKTNDIYKLEKDLLLLEKEYGSTTSINNFIKNQRLAKQLGLAVEIFAYGFIVLITAICIANILNTISTSVALREREFAMIKSVGMTPKDFQKMVRFESLFYGIKSLLYGIPLSFIVVIMLYRAMEVSLKQDIHYPVQALITAVAAIFLIVLSTMSYAVSKLKKKTLVEALKDENL